MNQIFQIALVHKLINPHAYGPTLVSINKCIAYKGTKENVEGLNT
jgi:hypothetical protein